MITLTWRRTGNRNSNYYKSDISLVKRGVHSGNEILPVVMAGNPERLPSNVAPLPATASLASTAKSTASLASGLIPSVCVDSNRQVGRASMLDRKSVGKGKGVAV